jgi:hypothetical protein
MENISQLVDESLARHGVEPTLNHLRLQWSKWFRCDSSFSVLLTPAKPGIFALGEEITSLVDGNKRMLAVFQISETDDLGMTLGRLFLPGNPLRERLSYGSCFARYTVIEDATQRATANKIFQSWIQESAETASGISTCGADILVRESANKKTEPNKADENLPSALFAWGMEVQNSETTHSGLRSNSFPAGF